MNYKPSPTSTRNEPIFFPCDAIIVLANLMDSDGNLNKISTARMEAAINAFQANEAPHIVTSGWDYRNEYPVPIAEAMRDYALQHGIPSEAIISDVNSRDTVGDAVFTKRNVVLPREWKRLLVITSDYHLPRTREIFTFVYGRDYEIAFRGVPALVPARSPEAEQASLQSFRTTFQGVAAGDDSAIWQRLIQNHPIYNGDIDPVYLTR